MSNSFSFTTDELQLVLDALQQLPFIRSAPLITRIMDEYNAQNAAQAATAGAIAEAAKNPANIVPVPPPNRAARRSRKGK